MEQPVRTSYFLHIPDVPFGLCAVALGDKVCAIQFTAIDDYIAAGTQHPLAVLQETEQQLRAYFAGTLKTFDVPLYMSGTPFQNAVWAELQKIPYGEVITYGELARRVHVPGGSRAAGLACHENPIPIIVPCHRVVGASHTLTGFGGGVDTKRYLLAHERCRELFIDF